MRSRHATLAWAGLALGLAVLVLQGAQTIPARMAEGGGAGRALVFFFSYLSVVALAGQVLVWLAAGTGLGLLRWLAGPTARTLMAGTGLAVMAGHASGLMTIGLPAPNPLLPDLLLHYLMPLVFLAWWATGPHPVRLRWGRLRAMAILPAGFALWVVVRGVTIGRWPYPAVEMPQIGWARGLVNLGLGVALGVLALVVALALSRVLHRVSRHGMFQAPQTRPPSARSH